MRSIGRQIPTAGWGSPPLFQSEGSHPDMITRLFFFFGSTICCCVQSRARFHFILGCNKLGRKEGMAEQGFAANFCLSLAPTSKIFNPICWAHCNSGTLASNHYCNLNVNPNIFQTLCLDLPMVDHGPYSVTFSCLDLTFNSWIHEVEALCVRKCVWRS